MIFTKMHGLGNNYCLFNQLDEPRNILEEQDYPELSRRVSDINFGIGSDGIILICPSDRADFKMRIFNEDGSEAKNCGNGLRCVAKYLFDHCYATEPHFTIETLGGVVSIEIEIEPNQKRAVQFVHVNMGEPKLLKGMIPMKGDPYSVAINVPYSIGNETYSLTCISMGNPHAIMFVDDVHGVPLETIGPIIERDDLFPDRVNVGIVHIKGRTELDYRVWERGSGITMACGTGACAAVVAATMNRMIDQYAPITIHLPGGDLMIRWNEQGHVWKSGAASYICHGELDIRFLIEKNMGR